MKKLFSAAALVVSLASVSAQQMGGPPVGINNAMLKMFGDTKAFTAKAQARMLDKEQKEITTLPLTMALRDGMLRAEMDMSEVKAAGIPPEAAAIMKQAGMDKMISIVRPDRKATIITYPGLQSYAEMPFSESDAAVDGKVDITDVGKETIDGHPCMKKKLTTTDAKGKTQEAFVWQASDLKNFPVQMEMTQKRNTLVVKFEAPKFETPEASLFDAPTGYTKYNSIQELMQSEMLKN